MLLDICFVPQHSQQNLAVNPLKIGLFPWSWMRFLDSKNLQIGTFPALPMAMGKWWSVHAFISWALLTNLNATIFFKVTSFEPANDSTFSGLKRPPLRNQKVTLKKVVDCHGFNTSSFISNFPLIDRMPRWQTSVIVAVSYFAQIFLHVTSFTHIIYIYIPHISWHIILLHW